MTAVATKEKPTTPARSIDTETMHALVTGGDCSRLSPTQQIEFYRMRCESVGLDPASQPFQFVKLNGGLKLYATKGATDQLAGKHGIVCSILEQRTEEGVRIVTVRATSKDGKSQEDIGVVPIVGKKGEDLANALMKAVTKAKRRTILSLCGLGMMDETEVESIQGAQIVSQAEHVPAEPITERKPIEFVESDFDEKKAGEEAPEIMRMLGLSKKEFGARLEEIGGAKWSAQSLEQKAKTWAVIKSEAGLP